MAAVGIAGQYNVTYPADGGLYVTPPQPLIPYIVPYEYGLAEAQVTFGGTIQTYGSVKVRMEWSGPDEPPPAVILEKYAKAAIVQGTGTVANGLGHPAVNGVSEGKTYEIIQNPGLVIERTITPSANSTHNVQNLAFAPVLVKVMITPTPIQIVVQGARDRIGGGLIALVGQSIACYIDCEGYALSNHFWWLPFENQDEYCELEWFNLFRMNSVFNLGYYEDHYYNDPLLNQPTVQFAGLKPISLTSISCQVTISKHGAQIASLTCSTGNNNALEIKGPSQTITHFIGSTSYEFEPANTFFYLRSYNPAVDPDYAFLVNMSDFQLPPEWNYLLDPNWGRFCFTQILDPDRKIYSGSNVLHLTQVHSLDNLWPYEPGDPLDNPLGDGFQLASNSTFFVDDSPWIGADYVWNNGLEVNNYYHMNTCFLPPDNGIGRVWVSCESRTFKWSASAFWNHGPPVFPGYFNSLTFQGAAPYPAEFLEWSDVTINEL